MKEIKNKTTIAEVHKLMDSKVGNSKMIDHHLQKQFEDNETRSSESMRYFIFK